MCLKMFSFLFLGCEFPDDWVGEWYLEGHREPIQLTKEDFADRGMCYKQAGNMHVIYSRLNISHSCKNFFKNTLVV